MAYMTELHCAGRGCSRKAVSVRIYGRYNSEEGLFCVSCGKRRLATLLKIEEDNDKSIRQRRDEQGQEAAEALRKQLR